MDISDWCGHLAPQLSISSIEALDMDDSEKFLRRIDRELLVTSVNNDLNLYSLTREPAALWRAYRACREYGEPVPEVILRYLDDLGKAAESGKSLTNLHKHERTYNIVSDVRLLLDLPGGRVTKDDACRRVAKRYGMTQSAVERMYERWLKKWPNGKRQRLKRSKPMVNSVFALGEQI